jgi:hypothetical protein
MIVVQSNDLLLRFGVYAAVAILVLLTLGRLLMR